MPPRAWRLLPVLAAAALMSAAAGCLFPPVEAPGDDPDGTLAPPTDAPRPTDNPRPSGTDSTRFRTMTDQKSAQGQIDFEVGALSSTSATHTFDLPDRLVQVVVTLEWQSAGAGDLDLAAELREAGATTTYWNDADTGGTASAPDDNDCRVESGDAERLSRPEPSELTARISAKAAVDTSYTVRVDFAYLVPI